MADWQWIFLFLLGVFILVMRNRRPEPPARRGESWGQTLNRKASDHLDYSDPIATGIRNDRNRVYEPEINNQQQNNDW